MISNSLHLYLIHGFVGLLIIAADQISKYWALTKLVPNESVQIFKMLSLRLVSNAGCAFSLFDCYGQAGRLTLSAVSLLIILILLKFLVGRINSNKSAYSELLLISGGLSNLIDRAYHGFVVDFIHLEWIKNFAIKFSVALATTFNIADLFIVFGAIMITKRIFE